MEAAAIHLMSRKAARGQNPPGRKRLPVSKRSAKAAADSKKPFSAATRNRKPIRIPATSFKSRDDAAIIDAEDDRFLERRTRRSACTATGQSDRRRTAARLNSHHAAHRHAYDH